VKLGYTNKLNWIEIDSVWGEESWARQQRPRDAPAHNRRAMSRFNRRAMSRFNRRAMSRFNRRAMSLFNRRAMSSVSAGKLCQLSETLFYGVDMDVSSPLRSHFFCSCLFVLEFIDCITYSYTVYIYIYILYIYK